MSGPRIVAVTALYPSPAYPEAGAFVAALWQNFRRQGATLNIIAPVPTLRAAWAAVSGRGIPDRSLVPAELRPRYWTTSARLRPFRVAILRANQRNFGAAVRQAFPGEREKYDFAYAHFWGAGWATVDVCEPRRLPCIVALGESALDSSYDPIWGPGTFARVLARFAGVVAVSAENEAICRRHCPQLEERLICLPNAVDTEHFKPVDRAAARRTLGLPEVGAIAVFCGHFIERKGPLRVARALKLAGGVRGVFLGRGAQRPHGQEVLHAGPVDHGCLPLWLAAADVFVLPSLQEGMSNAIIEALACGVPVVVADRAFNRSFLDETSATFVDPADPADIARGLNRLLHDPELARRQAVAGLAVTRRQNLAQRARRILDFSLAAAEHYRRRPASIT